ncbi:MAG: hypothetical protein ABII90_12290 [Bacteroidota bacterium]
MEAGRETINMSFKFDEYGDVFKNMPKTLSLIKLIRYKKTSDNSVL